MALGDAREPLGDEGEMPAGAGGEREILTGLYTGVDEHAQQTSSRL